MSTILIPNPTYIFTKVVQDATKLREYVSTRVTDLFKHAIYDPTNNSIMITTMEPVFQQATYDRLEGILSEYPDPPKTDQFSTSTGRVAMQTGYIPYAASAIIDGDQVFTGTTNLTRNMYYNNLTIAPGAILNTNGWRIIVSDTFINNGTVRFNGGHAVNGIPGVPSVEPYSTFLGSGTSGGAGTSTSGNGLAGKPALWSCTGGESGQGGSAFVSLGGRPGSYRPIPANEGGIHSLSVVPSAITGRTVSGGYLLGGLGAGSGAAQKGNLTSFTSGAGGSGAGLILIIASSIVGSGNIEAIGGNGGNAIYTGSATNSNAAVGGGAGGGGGCILIVSQQMIPSTLRLDVSGGSPGLGSFAGTNGEPGKPGNVFHVLV